MACIKTTQALAEMPRDPLAAQLARFNFGQKSYHTTPAVNPSSSKKTKKGSSGSGSGGGSAAAAAGSGGSRAAAVAAARVAAGNLAAPLTTDLEALPSAQGVVVLAQAVCLMRVVRKNVECEVGVRFGV